MKNIVLIFAILFMSVQTMVAQKSENSSFKENAWYGAHVGIGFGASSDRSDFSVKFAPLMGYRVLDFLSVGPRANISYQHTRFRDFNTGDPYLKLNFVDLGVGAFVRAEVFRQYFVQGELMYEQVEVLNTSLEEVKINGGNAYIGVGMNTGDQDFNADLMLMYDLNLQALRKANLIDLRFGFTLYY